MRTLGIPNTKHFHGITLIEDAKARKFLQEAAVSLPTLTVFLLVLVYEKLKEKVDVEQFKTTSMEEFEDSEGNVMSRKVSSGVKFPFLRILTFETFRRTRIWQGRVCFKRDSYDSKM